MATPYFKAVGVLSVAESRSWVVHFFMALNDIYLPSNVPSPSPTPLHQVRMRRPTLLGPSVEPGNRARHACRPRPRRSQTRGRTGPDRKGRAGHERACSGPGDLPGADAASQPLGGQRQVSRQGPPRRDRPASAVRPAPPPRRRELRGAARVQVRGVRSATSLSLGVLTCKVGVPATSQVL